MSHAPHDNPRYDKLMSALVAWYHEHPVSCAAWCDDEGDRSGALLGRVREIAWAERAQQRAEA